MESIFSKEIWKRKEARTIEDALIIIFSEILPNKEIIRSRKNLIERVGEDLFKDLCCMGYIKNGAAIIDGEATATRSVTKKREKELEAKQKRLNFNEDDLKLLEFYNKH